MYAAANGGDWPKRIQWNAAVSSSLWRLVVRMLGSQFTAADSPHVAHSTTEPSLRQRTHKRSTRAHRKHARAGGSDYSRPVSTARQLRWGARGSAPGAVAAMPPPGLGRSGTSTSTCPINMPQFLRLLGNPTIRNGGERTQSAWRIELTGPHLPRMAAPSRAAALPATVRSSVVRLVAISQQPSGALAICASRHASRPVQRRLREPVVGPVADWTRSPVSCGASPRDGGGEHGNAKQRS